MLSDREHIQPDLLGLLRDLHDGVDPLRLTRRLARDRVAGDVTDREDPELHAHASLGPDPGRVRRPTRQAEIYAFACSNQLAACAIPWPTLPGLSSVSITCLNSLVSQSKQAIWSAIPAQCRLRHPWRPGTVTLSWEPCECTAAQAARGGHF